MKQIYWLVFLSLFAKLNGQIITQSFNEPVISDLDRKFRLDTSAYSSGMPLNLSGQNCVWNFQNLMGTFPLVVDSFIAPTAAEGASLFPTATFVQHRDLYTFYRSSTSPSQTELLGGYTPSLTITFSNSAIIAGYPVNYGYNLTDPVSGTFKYNTTNGACNGNITISAAATGTVQLANNVSIPNVICLKSAEILTLSVGIFPFGTFNQTIYNYYAPGKKFPIININYTTYKLIAGSPTITAFVYGSNTDFNIGMPESQLDKRDYEVFPNPFCDELRNRADNQGEENEFFFYAGNGRLMVKTKSLDDDKIKALAPGVYFLETKNKKGAFHQKIIKE